MQQDRACVPCCDITIIEMPRSSDIKPSEIVIPLSDIEIIQGNRTNTILMDAKADTMPTADRRERLRVWVDEGLRKNGKTGQELALRLGISPPAVTGIRNGTRRIKADELPIIAEYLGSEPPGGADVPATSRGNSALSQKRHSTNMLKVVGVAEAGAFRQQDMLAQVAEPYLEVPLSEAFPNAKHYALLVRGDSMDRRGIIDGDYVSVVDYSEVGSVLKNGTIVHVQRSTDGGFLEWTIKEIHTHPDHYELRPRSSNSAHQSIIIPRRKDHDDHGEEVRILGVVIGVHRSLDF